MTTAWWAAAEYNKVDMSQGEACYAQPVNATMWPGTLYLPWRAFVVGNAAEAIGLLGQNSMGNN